ncbi:MAG: hypothetical protein QG587_2199, partial [Chloroflexota bacterium]|nr:hypothetical protein [Chloroflexota bacterium]
MTAASSTTAASAAPVADAAAWHALSPEEALLRQG